MPTKLPFNLPAGHEIPDLSKGLPIYDAQGNVFAYMCVADPSKYAPIVIDHLIHGWFGLVSELDILPSQLPPLSIAQL